MAVGPHHPGRLGVSQDLRQVFAVSLVEALLFDELRDRVNDPLFPKILIVLMLISSLLPLVPFFIHLCLRGYRNYIRGPWKMLHRVAFWIAVAALVLWVPFIASQESSQTR